MATDPGAFVVVLVQTELNLVIVASVVAVISLILFTVTTGSTVGFNGIGLLDS